MLERPSGRGARGGTTIGSTLVRPTVRRVRKPLWLLFGNTDLGVLCKVELGVSANTDLVVSANLDQVLLGKVAREFLWYRDYLNRYA